MGDIERAFGRRIRLLRDSAGLSQGELAKRAGLNTKFVGAIERGESNVTLITVEKLRMGLNAKLQELFAFKPREPMAREKVESSAVANLLAQFDSATRSTLLRLLKDVFRLTQKRL
jgi:transcriptional regulator with XRE-family HTH domain